MPNWVNIVLLGLIEGITEFLPVSSTGHLLLAEHFLPRQSDLFNTVIQSGAVLAVLVIFTGRVKSFFVQWRQPATQDYLAKLAVAFVITAAGGLLLKKMHFKLPETSEPVALATLFGGMAFIAVEIWLKDRPQSDVITWKIAVVVGLSQLLAAVFPGTSRSGSTILFALALGLARPVAAEFSFLLGIPTLLAAGGLQMVSALKDPTVHPDWGSLALGSAVAAVVAFTVVRWLLGYIRHHSFMLFGWYRVVLGIGMLIWAL
jgi:undecaprenyl-diphosphatase